MVKATGDDPEENAVQVALGGVETPVFLRDRGPTIDGDRIRSFESQLGHPLPDGYRAFLSAYNGGAPAVQAFSVPGRHLGASSESIYSVRLFLSLPSSQNDVPEHLRIRQPGDHPWGLPRDVLVIAEDDGGNLYVVGLAPPRAGKILFLDHEEEVDLETAPVVADDFVGWLLRFRTLERQAELDREEHRSQREALERGRLPKSLVMQIERTDRGFARVERSIRRACLEVFEDKGHFSLHGDDRSRRVFDLVCWLLDTSSGSRGIRRQDMHEALFDWCRDDDGGFGLRGFAPGFIDSWWRARAAEGTLVAAEDAGGRGGGEPRFRLRPEYVDRLLAELD